MAVKPRAQRRHTRKTRAQSSLASQTCAKSSRARARARRCTAKGQNWTPRSPARARAPRRGPVMPISAGRPRAIPSAGEVRSRRAMWPARRGDFDTPFSKARRSSRHAAVKIMSGKSGWKIATGAPRSERTRCERKSVGARSGNKQGSRRPGGSGCRWGAGWGRGRNTCREASARHGSLSFVQTRQVLDGWEGGLSTFRYRGHSGFDPRVPTGAAASRCNHSHDVGRAWDTRSTRRGLWAMQCRRRVRTHAPRADLALLKFRPDAASRPR